MIQQFEDSVLQQQHQCRTGTAGTSRRGRRCQRRACLLALYVDNENNSLDRALSSPSPSLLFASSSAVPLFYYKSFSFSFALFQVACKLDLIVAVFKFMFIFLKLLRKVWVKKGPTFLCPWCKNGGFESKIEVKRVLLNCFKECEV